LLPLAVAIALAGCIQPTPVTQVVDGGGSDPNGGAAGIWYLRTWYNPNLGGPDMNLVYLGAAPTLTAGTTTDQCTVDVYYSGSSERWAAAQLGDGSQINLTDTTPTSGFWSLGVSQDAPSGEAGGFALLITFTSQGTANAGASDAADFDGYIGITTLTQAATDGDSGTTLTATYCNSVAFECAEPEPGTEAAGTIDLQFTNGRLVGTFDIVIDRMRVAGAVNLPEGFAQTPSAE
jgi:hypothetical protein